MASPPTGTLTFLFTDIEGSTQLWEHDAPAMQAALARHDELLRWAMVEHGGYIFKTVGDAFCAAFPTGLDALECALDTQRKLHSSPWEQTGPLKVRIALHTGAAEDRDGDYFGPPLNRVARLLSAAHGGQVVLTLATQELVRDQLPGRTSLRDLGEHRLKDLFRRRKSSSLWLLGCRGEQVLFARLAVYSGGRTLEAVVAICDAEGDLPVDTFEGVSSPLDKSLLRQEEGPDEEPRFVMLETIHEYAREKLEVRAESGEIKRTHAQYFLALAEEAYPELKGANQLEWLNRLEAEHDNMRAAFYWALERNEAEVAIRLGGALWLFWFVRGYHSEGRRLLQEALAMDERGSPDSRAMALAGVGWLAAHQGDLDRAQEACEEGLQLLANEGRDASEARRCLLVFLGWVEREDYGRATQLFEESLALSQQLGDAYWHTTSLSNLALVSHYRRDSERATELYEESMDLFRGQGDRQSLAYCLNNLGMVAYSQGDLGRAAQLTEEGVALVRELGARVDVALGLCNLGWIALLQDDFSRAADLYRESLSLSWDTGLTPLVQSVLEGSACLAGAKGDAERAGRLWGAAQILHELKGIPRDDDFFAEADACISAVRSAMGEETWEKARREGRVMTVDEAVSYALEEEVGA